MSQPIKIPAWQRPHWQPSAEEIVLQFYVFGKFQGGRPPLEAYGSKGLPTGIELTSHAHAALRAWEGYPLKGAAGRMFKEDAPEAYQLAQDAPEVLVLRGRIQDSADTGYLRDTLAALAALLDTGGVAVLDPQILTLFDAESWRQRYLLREGAPIRNHLLILRDHEEAEGYSRVRTRGMRKLGRPDILLERVPNPLVDRAGLLCERLVELQALGAHFNDGQHIDMEGAHGDLVAHLEGSLDDPHFNNTFVRFRWPE